MRKALDQMNLQLHHLISDITGDGPFSSKFPPRQSIAPTHHEVISDISDRMWECVRDGHLFLWSGVPSEPAVAAGGWLTPSQQCK